MDHNQFKSKTSYYFGQPTKERIQKWIEMLSSYSDELELVCSSFLFAINHNCIFFKVVKEMLIKRMS